jgi:hypothetical protein
MSESNMSESNIVVASRAKPHTWEFAGWRSILMSPSKTGVVVQLEKLVIPKRGFIARGICVCPAKADPSRAEDAGSE